MNCGNLNPDNLSKITRSFNSQLRFQAGLSHYSVTSDRLTAAESQSSAIHSSMKCYAETTSEHFVDNAISTKKKNTDEFIHQH